MKKTYKIDVDCAACADKMELAAQKTEGVKDCTVNFMTLKMTMTHIMILTVIIKLLVSNKTNIL